ncbi:hypothetical protein DMN91_008114 [Ooceraea biroi]|uniref:Uncharacterized protein n=1 Tax=Ooceraea biroi TaxID=2015173 RepID=A0A3L8DGI2_OOCBI|nr:uncharacterized protein LOC105285632 isoform X1 [Ooceraea biroi]RLU19557.1 hypothetical protein DMN91_008114 [Ooceraea biroi]
MFHYLRYIYREHVNQWANNVALENDSSELSIDTNTVSCFLEPLKNSRRLANLRKTKHLWLREKISSDCTEINSRLPQLYGIIEADELLGLTRQFATIALATIYYNLGIIYKDCLGLQDLQVSLDSLSRSRELLRGNELDCDAILIVVKSLVAMSEIQATQRWLSEAVKLYLQYSKRDNFRSKPIYTYLADVLKQDLRILLILLYEKIIKRMEVIYSASDEMDEWIKTVHDCLNNRVRIIKSLDEACKWSNAAITISTYLINKLRFHEARNCLAAAEYILDSIEENPSYNVIRYTVKNLQAKVANAWLTYTNYILRESCSYLQAQQQTSYVPIQRAPQELLLFTSLRARLGYFTNRITDSRVSNTYGADIVTDFAVDQYMVACTIFSALGNDGDYFIAMSKCALVFKYLASFSTDIDFQIQVYKCQRKFFYDNYSKYVQKARLLPEFVSDLVVILKMWKDATQKFLSVIEGIEEFPNLYSITQRTLRFIISTLDDYEQIDRVIVI